MNSTDDARKAVRRFFGNAAVSDFSITGDQVIYSGPEEWSYRRFILHYAHLCAIAGGVDAFLIGSEMRGLTQIMGAAQTFPAVEELCQIAGEVRAILGPDVKLGYASDWSEYFGYHPGGGDVYFHLDPLWADDNIDFIGIDNYMPLSDWREGEDHADAHWRRITNQDYLRGNVCGGEGFDWYYADPAHREAQIRTKIEDGAYGEDWVWRYKDIKGWWENPHFNRINNVRQPHSSAWKPKSKPIWFTEYGCAALDKATNQPNKFLDALSSESQLPYYSNGRRDDAIQAAYIKAVTSYWADGRNNPIGPWGGHMVDMDRAHIWCWDARPFPAFPGRTDLWSDGPAWERGHWLNGRAGAVALADIVSDLCHEAGIERVDTAGLVGVVRGYSLGGHETGRAAIQGLMLAYGFDAIERDGILRFRMRDGRVDAHLCSDDLAVDDGSADVEIIRAPDAELAGRVRLTHIEAGGDYAARTVEAILPGIADHGSTNSEMPLALLPSEGRAIAERWLAEARISCEAVRFSLPPSCANLGTGDVVSLSEPSGVVRRWRIDRIERAGSIKIDAVRIEAGTYQPSDGTDLSIRARQFLPPMPVWPVFLDLPLIRGEEVEHAPHIAVSAKPWPGSVAVLSSEDADQGFEANVMVTKPSLMGRSLGPLFAARGGQFDRGAPFEIRLGAGTLESVNDRRLLSGANLMAIGDGRSDHWELFQFGEAHLVRPGVWALSRRLRGLAGTDAIIPEEWPAGSVVVLLNGAAEQVVLPPAAMGQIRHWRIGPALRGHDDGSYRQRAVKVRGIGKRPLSPVHLKVDGSHLSWIRRTRIGGDRWDLREVPLGEAHEEYVVRLVRDGVVLHEGTTKIPRYDVAPSVWNTISAAGPFVVEVAQSSEEFGPGLFQRKEINVE